MRIRIGFGRHKDIIYIKNNASVIELKIYFFNEFPHTDRVHQATFAYCGQILQNDKRLSDYGIGEGCLIQVIISSISGGCIDNLKEESKTQIAKKIGFDMELIKRDEININLIHFDLNMTNGENYRYFNNFKVDVVGGFHAMDDINILKKLLAKIEKKDIPFLVVSSGSSGKDIIPICKKYSFIKEVIIFCMNYEYNKHYIDEYPIYVKKVVTSIGELYNYLKEFSGKIVCQKCNPEAPYQFKDYEIQMDNQIQECPVITAEEYDKCYFLVHKAYSYFFGDFESKYHSFGEENFNIIGKLLTYLYERGYFEKSDDRPHLSDIFKELRDTKVSKIFVEKSLRKYTGESVFCYLFNRMMRNIETGIIYLSYYMGPFLFEINKYVKNREECAFSKSMTLYRKFNCSETEFYLYKLNLNHVICFPALTSTSSTDINFEPTELAASVNKTGNDSVKVKLILKYNHENDNISPGIIIENKKAEDNKTISPNSGENEVLLFPFTFAKILNINSEIKYGEEIKIVNLELINRKSYLELTLRDNVEKRPKFACN